MSVHHYVTHVYNRTNLPYARPSDCNQMLISVSPLCRLLTLPLCRSKASAPAADKPPYQRSVRFCFHKQASECTAFQIVQPCLYAVRACRSCEHLNEDVQALAGSLRARMALCMGIGNSRESEESGIGNVGNTLDLDLLVVLWTTCVYVSTCFCSTAHGPVLEGLLVFQGRKSDSAPTLLIKQQALIWRSC